MYSTTLKGRIEASWYSEDVQLPPAMNCMLRAMSLGWQASVAVARQCAVHRSLGVPTLGISSVLVGGSGKTPLARWVAELCRNAGMTPAVITRGYGGSLSGPVRVMSERHTAAEVGDEPVWLAANLSAEIPVIVARHRVEGCVAAVKEWGAKMVVLDDALMLFSLQRDLDVMVLGSASWLGNRRCLPAGPLRMPLGTLMEADAVFVVDEPGEPHIDASAFLQNRPDRIEVFRASLSPREVVGPDDSCFEPDFLKDRPVVAWAGIARAWRFRDLVEALGARLCAFSSFPDHHVYSTRDLEGLLERVRAHDALPLTTAKDMARWPVYAQWRPYHLAVAFNVEEHHRAADFILRRMMERINE